MLILTRKLDESIVINDNITIKVISIDKGIVKLGIDAPREVSILRSELIQAIMEENKKDSLSMDESLLQSFYSKFKK